VREETCMYLSEVKYAISASIDELLEHFDH